MLPQLLSYVIDSVVYTLHIRKPESLSIPVLEFEKLELRLKIER